MTAKPIAIYTYRAASDLPRAVAVRWTNASRNYIDPSGRRIGAHVVVGRFIIAILWGEPAGKFNQTRRLRRKFAKREGS